MTSIRHTVSPEDRYLDAAREAILAVGWSRTTLTDVARRAGVSRMTLYRRWPDTGTLLADLMTREWARTVERALDGTSAGSAEEVADAVVAVVAALRADPLLRRIVDVDPETLLPYLLDRRGRSQELLAGLLADTIAGAQRTGAVRPGDPALLARSLLLASQGFLLSAHTMAAPETGPGGRDADVTAYDEQLRALVRGYLS
ncbi:TetR/AcrR family transcriptional regulator [Nocardioides aequoreus]|uniref:TetR/AcrR family transcriptional regulator n=1 Tax=Nocardioides aequoreus TaxID=397278 RepID=UPI0004C465F8|nr:TetR/AcrR family transcriptional regulator [Nocardioides aequoreus]